MRESAVKKKLKSGEVILRAFLRFPNPSAAEIMALAGVDLIVIDNEHYPFNEEQVAAVVRAAGLHGAECMVRVPNPEPARIAQMMDAGLCGVVAPHIETEEEAMAVVNAVKYAPMGTRGFCPITRAAGYGYAMAAAEFAAFSNAQTSVILMTETKKGVENLDAILAIPGVDAISIGPADLAASYGYPGRFDHPEVVAAFEAGQRKIVAAGKGLCAQTYNAEAARLMYDRGARVLTIGSDVQMLAGQFQRWVAQLQQGEKRFLQERGAQA